MNSFANGTSKTVNGILDDDGHDLLTAWQLDDDFRIHGSLVNRLTRSLFLISREVDPSTNDRVMLLADKRDSAPLLEKQGPIRLIVAGDTRPARWFKMLDSISVHRAI